MSQVHEAGAFLCFQASLLDDSIPIAQTDVFSVPMFPFDIDTKPSRQRLRHPNRVRKGEGSESRRLAPDLDDDYPYESCSKAYIRLSELNLGYFSMVDVVRMSDAIEADLLCKGVRITPRNRMAKRRKPNAFHWLDKNWSAIAPVFNAWAVRAKMCPRSSHSTSLFQFYGLLKCDTNGTVNEAQRPKQ
jgi:hypothetical protein